MDKDLIETLKQHFRSYFYASIQEAIKAAEDSNAQKAFDKMSPDVREIIEQRLTEVMDPVDAEIQLAADEVVYDIACYGEDEN